MDKIIKYKRNALIITSLFIVLSIYFIYTASNVWSLYKFNDEFYYLKRQIVYALISLIILFSSTFININFIKKYNVLFLMINLMLLILVLIPGIGINKGGSYSWLGFSMISFQPSELYKIILIIFLSNYLSDNFHKTDKIKVLIIPLMLISLSSILIMLQPDFGSLMVIMISVIVLLFLCKVKLRFFIIGGLILLMLLIIMIISAPYRLDRIISYIDPFSDPLGSGFQIIQSLYALGPGGLIGQGVNASMQKYYYLPEPQTDFIFAIIVEEFGLIGGLVILFLYALLFYYLYKIISNKRNKFLYLMSFGFLSLIVGQVIINLGVVTSLLPVTGITLPFLSYGGSSLLILSFSIGLICGRDE